MASPVTQSDSNRSEKVPPVVLKYHEPPPTYALDDPHSPKPELSDTPAHAPAPLNLSTTSESSTTNESIRDLYSTPSTPSGRDLNTTGETPDDVMIPAVLFAIPFPVPARAKEADDRPTFLLYAPPRAAYRKPVNEDGTPGKEKFIKKVERGWQEEVAQGVAIREGEVPDASRWQRTKGALTRTAAKLIQKLPDSNIEALSRIPPKQKIQKALVFMPKDPNNSDTSLADEEKQLAAQLARVRKAAVTKAAVSGVLLPVTGMLDWVVPIFAFEVDAAYFSAQLQGLRKATALTSEDLQMDLQPSDELGPIQTRLRALCKAKAPEQFLGSGPAGSGDASRAAAVRGAAGGRSLAEAVVSVFRAAVPPEVAARHALDDLDALAADVDRCLRKGVEEYTKTL